MRKILITGANSYIGTSFENYIKQWPDMYQIDKVRMSDGSWHEKSFAGYDTVFHVAGIAHIKETEKNKELYFSVNRDLASEVAQKAKTAGVKQFIFLSSMSVYGNETGIIGKNTVPEPKSCYGKSKLEAEQLINEITDGNFKAAILRPPMVYGKDCKGNYPSLSRWVDKCSVFPDFSNSRSMLYIGNLVSFVKCLIDNDESGLFFPQNSEYVCTTEMIRYIAEKKNKKMHFIRIFNPAIKLIKSRSEILEKVFGDFCYEQEMSVYKEEYRVFGLKESVMLTEK